MPAEDYQYQSRRFKKRAFAVLNQNTHVNLKKHGVYMITTTGMPVDDIVPFTLTRDTKDSEITKIASKLAHKNHSKTYQTIKDNIHYGLMGASSEYHSDRLIVFESLKDQDLWLRHESYFTLFFNLALLNDSHFKHVAHKNYGINLFPLMNRINNLKQSRRRSRKHKKVGIF